MGEMWPSGAVGWRAPVRRIGTGGGAGAPAITFLSPDLEGVYALWDELDGYPAAETDAALAHLAGRLRGLLRAANVRWLGLVRTPRGARAGRDLLRGWRFQAGYELVPDSQWQGQLALGRREAAADFPAGLATPVLIAEAGKFQVHRLREGWRPFREFARSEAYRRHYAAQGITDRLWVGLPLHENAASVFVLDRGAGPPFTRGEAVLAGTILRGLRGLHRRLFLDRGLSVGERPLSPVSRRIVQKLLTGRSEKEVALAVGQSLPTTHKYIKSIYERFGVNGRAALMALWLGS